MEKNSTIIEGIIQKNSPDGGFLQSDWWKKFQFSVGRKSLNIKGDTFWNNIFEHKLPIVGRYYYIPRGNIFNIKNKDVRNYLENLTNLAKSSGAGWIRVEPATEEMLHLVENNINIPIVKAPHEMQPKEIFIIDCSKSEDQLLSEMKSKTRYNIRLAEKKKVEIRTSNNEVDVNRFYDLVEITNNRQSIRSHPREYYQKMFETIPSENIKLYYAQFEGKMVAANIVVFFGDVATYLHGASDDHSRNVMAPYLLQWRQIQDAKKKGALKYDFGGVKTSAVENKWAGITRFKKSFSPATKSVEFPGNYDIILSPVRYRIYRLIQKIKCHL